MPYTGSCHCGAVTFTVAADAPTEAMSCNCSHCSRKGFLLAIVPADQFTLNSGEDKLTDYQFYKHKITHRFCNICGTQSFAEGDSPTAKPVPSTCAACPRSTLTRSRSRKWMGRVSKPESLAPQTDFALSRAAPIWALSRKGRASPMEQWN